MNGGRRKEGGKEGRKGERGRRDEGGSKKEVRADGGMKERSKGGRRGRKTEEGGRRRWEVSRWQGQDEKLRFRLHGKHT